MGDQWGRWSKWANTLFKRDKPLGSEPWFNPEAVTEQKREWIERQEKVQDVQEVAWPEHIYENFFVVGLPPDMELTQVAEQLCDLERKRQRSDADTESEQLGKEHLQPPQPSFKPQVLLRAPPGAPAPISDDEVAAFCFPSGVAPEKLRRTPSLSALDELVMGRDSDQQQQCFVFMLKVGGNFPLYGCCWYVREMLHRPPYLAQQEYRSCRAPFRQCMIAAPRCYCLLSHYPFFDLHFRVLKIVLDLERLERLLEYDSEKSKLRPPGPNLLAPSSPQAHTAAAATMATAAAAGSRRSMHDGNSGGGSLPGSHSSSAVNSRAQSPVGGSKGGRSSAGGGGQLMQGLSKGSSGGGAPPAASEAAAGAEAGAGAAAAGMQQQQHQQLGASAASSRRHTPDSAVQAHVLHNRQLYCAECAGIIEDMCPFTPGAGPEASPPSWSQWQQQRQQQQRAGPGGPSPLRGQQQQQSELQQQGLLQQQQGLLQQQQQGLLQQQQQEQGPLQLQQQQQPHMTSPMGPDSQAQTLANSPPPQQQQQQQQGIEDSKQLPGLQQVPSPPSVADSSSPARCEVCGKRLCTSTPDGSLLSTAQHTSLPSAAAAAAAPAGDAAEAAADTGGSQGGGSTKQGPATLVGAIASALPARIISAALQSVGSTGSSSAPAEQAAAAAATASQQQQQFDAVAAAAADFDAASARSSRANGRVQQQQQPEQALQWQGVVSAVRGAHSGQQQQQQQALLSRAGSSSNSLHEFGLQSGSVPETSMVQRMWEVWAPKALESQASSHAGSAGGALSGGLGLFKRHSRASGTMADSNSLTNSSTTRTGSPVLEAAAAAAAPAAAVTQPGAADAAGATAGAAAGAVSSQQQQQDLQVAEAAVQQQQHAGLSVEQLQHSQQQQQQQAGGRHHHSSAGPSRLRHDGGHSQAAAADAASTAAADASSTTAAANEARGNSVTTWQADPDMRPLRSFRNTSADDISSAPFLAGGTEGPVDVSAASNASFYSIEDGPFSSSSSTPEAAAAAAGAAGGAERQREGQQQQLQTQQNQQNQQHLQQQAQHQIGQSRSESVLQQQQQQYAVLGRRGRSEVHLGRQPSPPPGSGVLPVVQLQARRQQRWSDPSHWPSKPRAPSPLPLLSISVRGSQPGKAPAAGGAVGPTAAAQHSASAGGAGAEGIVSAFAAIAAAAEPFDASISQHATARPSTSSLEATELGDSSGSGSVDSLQLVEDASAAPLPAAAPEAAAEAAAAAAADGSDSSSVARVNVTITGGLVPSSAGSKVQLQQLVLQPPSRSGSGRRSALFEEVALRRSGDMSNQLRTTISHLVQVDSSTLLAAYYASPVPQPDETYRLLLGDLYRLEFERSLPLQQYAPPGRSRLRQEVLSYAEVECAHQLQLWAVAALCRSLSVDNLLTLLNAVLLEKQLVVFCPHIGTLGSVVLALVPLLRPFSWQSLMMPVTPVSMLGFLDAPVPFVLGVQYKTPDVAGRCHGLVRVNVYKDAIKNASFPAMPHMRQLAASLAPYHAALREAAPLAVERPVHVTTPDEEEAARGLLGVMHEYLSTMCGDLRLHTIVNVGMSKRTGVFMKESLLESLPAKDRGFMRAFMETQMFAAYADGIISDYCEG